MATSEYFIHPAAIVDTTRIGHGTRIWAFVHILDQVHIGADCNICDHCFIEQGVRIGDRVTLKSYIHLCDGVTLEDDVFLGPGVTFTNDITPRSRAYEPVVKTLISRGASVGANVSILAGVTIGEYAMVGMGSVITRDVKPHALVYGNPARQNGWVDEQGEKLSSLGNGKWKSVSGNIFAETTGGLLKRV